MHFRCYDLLDMWVEDPLFHLVLLSLVYWFRPRKMLRNTIILYAFIVLLTPIPAWLGMALEGRYEVPQTLTRKDAAVILTGATVHRFKNIDQFDWQPSSDRVMEAIRLYKRGLVGLILVTGTEKVNDQLEREVTSIRDVAIEFGVPSEAIVLEDQARNTFENALFASRILREKKISDFYLVTTAMHMPRAMALFEKQEMHPTAYPVDRYVIHRTWLEHLMTGPVWRVLTMHGVYHECMGFIWYRLKGYL